MGLHLFSESVKNIHYYNPNISESIYGSVLQDTKLLAA